MSGDRTIKVGSRKSELALIQTNHVIALLKDCYPHKEFEIVTMMTMGDQILDKPLPKIGEKSLFTKELEDSLAKGDVDFLVHSLKDLPTCLPSGMAIGAVLSREDPRDSLILREDLKGHDLNSLPKDSVIGTSSLRRAAQLARKYPHLKIESIRGNLNTRLRKLDQLDKFHGIVLATAGLHRMGWHNRISKILETDELLYAVGQGALAVECRENDLETLALLKPLFDVETALAILAERSFLKTLEGGCSAPVAVISNITYLENDAKKISLEGAVWSLDGKQQIVDKEEVEVHYTIMRKCKECPYKTEETANNIIHCPVKCGSKRASNAQETSEATKKTKLDKSSLEILKEHPHDHCPFQIPIGADFMGKCPFLEQAETSSTNSIDVNKCPFIKAAKLEAKSEIAKVDAEESNLFCGLVKHPDISELVMQKTQELGAKLAEKLVRKGAKEIMEIAQNSIRKN